ncbi:MAG: glycosyltransferase family 4 protein [Anaerolineales bacterium]|nr:glycosyltransferase family 4 protein [Anaerolineales bacterium]
MKIAFVTPWYGPNIPGGAESEARRTLAHLHAAGYDVEVLTTCIRDFYAPWDKNHYPPGADTVDGIPVRRFPVGRRDKAAFDAVNWQLMQGRRVSPADEHTYINEMFRCPDLLAHIESRAADTLFFFIPYMFATTYFGAQIHPRHTAVIPCLHDEAYAYMDLYKQVLPHAHTLILHTPSELALANRLFGPPNGQQRLVVGEGVDSDFTADANRFRRKYGLDGPFFLYAGRRESGKNVPLLLDYWQRYAAETPTAVPLVFIGPGDLALPPGLAGRAVDLGFVPLQDKYDAYAAATALCQPSQNESFSLVLMEAWLAGTPALVNGRCAVTRDHCRLSNGGLYFNNYPEFAATVNYLLAHPDTARQMGQNGRRYVLANFQWPAIIQKYAAIINHMTPNTP